MKPTLMCSITPLKNPPNEAEHRGLFHEARSWGWLGGSVGSGYRNVGTGLWGGGDRRQTKDVSEIRVKIGTKTPAHGVSCWPGHQDGRGARPPVAKAGLGRGPEARVCMGSCRKAGEGWHGRLRAVPPAWSLPFIRRFLDAGTVFPPWCQAWPGPGTHWQSGNISRSSWTWKREDMRRAVRAAEAVSWRR